MSASVRGTAPRPVTTPGQDTAPRPGTASLQDSAARIAAEVAARLADPERVAAVTGDSGNRIIPDDGREPYSPWTPTTLSEGHPSVSLLFAEMGAREPRYRVSAHEHIAATLRHPAPPPVPALYRGSVSLAFAAQMAARRPDDYGRLRDRLDEAITAQVHAWTSKVRARLARGEAIGSWQGYDLIVGVSGAGRYLLERRSPGRDAALRDVLGLLAAVAVADDVVVNGTVVPAWWVHHGREYEQGPGVSGHLNLGLAHGVPGPLSLLSLAWRAGVRVERQDEAIARIVALLDRWRADDEAGPFWPFKIGLDGISGDGPAPYRTRDALCYGAVGVARALYLAGAALDRADWVTAALAALRGALATADDHRIVDLTLCHGWAGVLQITHRMACDTGEPDLATTADALAARVVGRYDPVAPFGYRHHVRNGTCGPDRPGFLEGAAGIALALQAYATGRPPLTNWDAALLLA